MVLGATCEDDRTGARLDQARSHWQVIGCHSWAIQLTLGKHRSHSLYLRKRQVTKATEPAACKGRLTIVLLKYLHAHHRTKRVARCRICTREVKIQSEPAQGLGRPLPLRDPRVVKEVRSYLPPCAASASSSFLFITTTASSLHSVCLIPPHFVPRLGLCRATEGLLLLLRFRVAIILCLVLGAYCHDLLPQP